MSEEMTIFATKKPNTIQSLVQDFKALGINQGDILLVHSSMSRLGWVCGGAQAVITALLNAVGRDGTIVMPAHSADLSDPAEWENPPVPSDWIPIIYEQLPAFDPQLTPTRGMGQIAELFRTIPNTLRSDHPQGSFCANGKHAKEITEKHPLTPQFGIDSPLGTLYKLRANVLLLGTGYDSCTSFHLAESLIDEMPIKRMGAPVLDEGKRCWKWFDDYDYCSDDFQLIGKEFEKTGHVRTGKVGNAEAKLFSLQEGVDFAKQWLITHRFSQSYS